ncbi:MAG: hypothetical protein SPI83_02990 [Rothia sp. (in: high G+C Gram-positive bacteria)]|nr:hypothetical protein [Rothia sp. (in: high G+C Gram-positive bacteria)]
MAVSRRTLAKGAAWAAPAVVATTTIPAYAASPDVCSNTNTEASTGITWTNFVRATPVAANGSDRHTGSVMTNDGKARLTITHVSSSGPTLSNSQNLITKYPTNDGVSFPSYSGFSDYLFFQTLQSGQNGYSGGNQQTTITMRFSEPVTNFTFDIGDVDQGTTGSGGPWQDVFTVKSSLNGVATSAPLVTGGATISTSGDTTTFTALSTSNNLSYNSTAGNVTLSFPEPLDTITLTWGNGSNRTGAQNFVIGGPTTLNVCPRPVAAGITPPITGSN